ncbi:biotin transporter BioY [Streptomyces lydicamycinicus]|uniref:biotin transporter BioY n=1 Tax=Streptomyces lydicamycinicus TaxID=1546107 RepID=UPI00203542CC|nr:biotin transporter BioY [Streptomyces lydicamycinicus]USA00887.1 biotin transporter BioY [Streptomyces lydicamycinicus]
MNTETVRPAVTELRLSAFKTHRGVTLPLTRLTLLSGESGSGKSSALQAYEILARLGSGESLARAVGEVAGSPTACVPAGARPDAQGRRGFRIGCTVDGPAGPVSLDLAVQAEPELRIVGERLTGGGETLLTTALTDPDRPTVQAAWHTAGATPVTRAPLPDDRLGTSLLPLRVAGKTAGQRLVLAAAEQVVVALRSAFVCDPRPEAMRGAGTGGPGEPGRTVHVVRTVPVGRGVAPGCGGVAGKRACPAGRGSRAGPAGLPGPGGRGSVRGPAVRRAAGPAIRRGRGPRGGCGRPATTCPRCWSGRARSVRDGMRCWSRRYGRPAPVPSRGCVRCRGRRAVRGIDRRRRRAGRAGWGSRAEGGGSGCAGRTRPGELGELPVEQLGDGELRFLALALVLLTGPEVLAMDPVGRSRPLISR